MNKSELIENLKNTIHLYCDNRKHNKDTKWIEDWLVEIMKICNYQWISNRIVARLKMRQLESIYNSKTQDERIENCKNFFSDFLIHFRW
jgi:hypothetical protein